jgi:hypothetical protein
VVSQKSLHHRLQAAILPGFNARHNQIVTGKGEIIMPHYLLAGYLPDDFDPSVITEATIEGIHALNREIIAAGVRKFACGISPAGSAKSLRAQPDGKVLVTDGPYLETKEHIGGFWVLEAADLDEALEWGRKSAAVGPTAGEVRPIFFRPADRPSDDSAMSDGSPSQRKQYLVAIYHPDDFDPSAETEATINEIHALNREMIAAGVRKFAAGLSGPSNARSVRAQSDGKVLVTDGPYLETKEHIGGFWVLEAADLDEALAWARKAVVACRAPVEVREIFFMPPPAIG